MDAYANKYMDMEPSIHILIIHPYIPLLPVLFFFFFVVDVFVLRLLTLR